jgi:hypothetical protein
MRLIYVAGKYGAPTQEGISANIAHARQAAINLWRSGWSVFCPHMNTAHLDDIVKREVFLDGDLEILKRCDAIYMLSNWQESEGAKKEYALAKYLELEIYFEDRKQAVNT